MILSTLTRRRSGRPFSLWSFPKAGVRDAFTARGDVFLSSCLLKIQSREGGSSNPPPYPLSLAGFSPRFSFPVSFERPVLFFKSPLLSRGMSFWRSWARLYSSLFCRTFASSVLSRPSLSVFWSLLPSRHDALQAVPLLSPLFEEFIEKSATIGPFPDLALPFRLHEARNLSPLGSPGTSEVLTFIVFFRIRVSFAVSCLFPFTAAIALSLAS